MITRYYPRFIEAHFDWWISDPHFKHDKIRELSKRPFSSVEEMDEIMILNWNKCVQPGQKIICIGDFSLTKDKVYLDKLFKRLQGDKYLIPGNHDHWLKHEDLHHHWTLLCDVERFTFTQPDGVKRNAVVSHFPHWTWESASRGNWMIHGHCHGNADYANVTTTRIDVGVDSTAKYLGEYRPISWQELCTQMKNKEYLPVDHHGNRKDEE